MAQETEQRALRLVVGDVKRSAMPKAEFVCGLCDKSLLYVDSCHGDKKFSRRHREQTCPRCYSKYDITWDDRSMTMTCLNVGSKPEEYANAI